jgi:hypothetical protein
MEADLPETKRQRVEARQTVKKLSLKNLSKFGPLRNERKALEKTSEEEEEISSDEKAKRLAGLTRFPPSCASTRSHNASYSLDTSVYEVCTPN